MKWRSEVHGYFFYRSIYEGLLHGGFVLGHANRPHLSHKLRDTDEQKWYRPICCFAGGVATGLSIHCVLRRPLRPFPCLSPSIVISVRLSGRLFQWAYFRSLPAFTTRNSPSLSVTPTFSLTQIDTKHTAPTPHFESIYSSIDSYYIAIMIASNYW